MAKIGAIFREDQEKEPHKADLHPKRVTKWIHYTKLKDNKKQYRSGKTTEEKQEYQRKVEALADLIDADGEVLQDLRVRKTGTDEYEIIAGHTRRDACRLLVEERSKQQYAFLPCIIKDLSDVRAEFQLYSSNGYAQKTHYEIMCELEGMKHLLVTYPEEFPDLQTGRMVERLEKQLGMKKTTVGEYLQIAKNLSDKAMEAFRIGTVKKSAALSLSSLPKSEQDELLTQDVTTNQAIIEYKESKLEHSVLGLPKRIYPESSLLTTPGCGAYDCFCCHRPDCSIRQETCHCVEAPLGDPYPCQILQTVGSLQKELGMDCEFVNLELAEKRSGDGEPIPCCKHCINPCRYACNYATAVTGSIDTEQEKQTDIQMDQTDQPSTKVEPPTLAVGTYGADTKFQISADQNLRSGTDHDVPDSGTHKSGDVNPDFPILSNMEEREAFVKNYQQWPVWSENNLTEETYYRYDLPDGSAIVVREYPFTGYWEQTEERGMDLFLVLPDKKHFRDCVSNMTEIKNHLRGVKNRNESTRSTTSAQET